MMTETEFPKCAGCKQEIRTFMEYFEHWCPELGAEGRSLTVEQWMGLPSGPKETANE